MQNRGPPLAEFNRVKKMKNKKVKIFLRLGRKISFSLALFILVFAVTSFVKIQAAGNATGWPWGGTEEQSDGDFYNGLSGWETGVGWISLNGDNPEVPGGADYGVTIPSSDGAVTEYAWSENIGWIQFDPSSPYPTSNPNFSTKRVGNNLEGWARIVAVKDALAVGNSGNWQGWIKMSGIATDSSSYGVQVNSDNTLSGYGWSDELGWINFGEVGTGSFCSMTITPSTFTLGSAERPIEVTVTIGTPNADVAFDKFDSGENNYNPNAFNLDSASCNTGGSGSCSINVSATDRTKAWTVGIRASVPANPGCGTKDTTGTIEPLLNCNISCPSEYEVTAGETDKYGVTVGGESGCELDRCTEGSDPNNIIETSPSGSSCQVVASSSARYGSVDVTSATNGTGECTTTVYVKGPGWIETNP